METSTVPLATTDIPTRSPSRAGIDPRPLAGSQESAGPGPGPGSGLGILLAATAILAQSHRKTQTQTSAALTSHPNQTHTQCPQIHMDLCSQTADIALSTNAKMAETTDMTDSKSAESWV